MTYNSRTVLNVVALQVSAKRKNNTRVLESYHTALVTDIRGSRIKLECPGCKRQVDG